MLENYKNSFSYFSKHKVRNWIRHNSTDGTESGSENLLILITEYRDSPMKQAKWP